MRIAHLTTVDLSLRYLIMPQLTAMVARGAEVIGISAPGPHVPDLEAAGIRHIPLAGSTRGFNPLADLRAAWNLWRILRRERPDLLHTHNPKPGLYGRVVGRLAGVPVVVNTVHGLYATPDDGWPKRAVVYGLEAVASAFSHAELVQSREDFELLTRWRITPRSRTHLLGNGVDLERFDPGRFDAAHRRRVRAEWGAGDRHVVVGIVGRLVEEKGFPELFAAVRRLDDRYLLVVVGPHDPDKADSLEQRLVDEARAAGVVFLGMRSDVDALYPAMDIFVLPSHREGFPRSAMEAAAMGLPVIATDIRGCREVVIPGDNGLLVPVRDPAALAEAITSLGADEQRRAAMGRAGRRRALSHFDEAKVVEKVVETQLRALRAKGMEPAAHGRPRLRRATQADAAAIARLHATGITTGFLPRLGSRFLRRLYRSMIDWPDAVVIVADDGYGPVGFVAGVGDVGTFYKHFAKRHGVAGAAAAFPQVLRPSNLARAWETWRYPGARDEVAAELLAMAVEGRVRGGGLGTRLGERFLDEGGWPAVKVVVGVDNPVAQAVYRKMGFADAGTIEVHPGERSLVMIRRESSADQIEE